MVKNNYSLALICFTVAFFCKTTLCITSVKIGILYDESHKSAADDVNNTFTQLRFNDVIISTAYILQKDVPNSAGDILGLNLAAILSVVGKLDCTKISVLGRLLPIYSIAKTLHPCEGDLGITYLFPASSSIISALSSSGRLYDWHKAVVFEKQSNEIGFSFGDMQYTREQGIETIAYEANEDNMVGTMKLARKEGLREFVLTSSVVSAPTIMETAKEMQLVTSNFHWFLPNTFFNPEDFLNIAEDGTRMTFLSSPIVTPLVRQLMANYKAQNINVTSARIYDDVTGALALLAVDQVVAACESLSCGEAEHGMVVCAPRLADIDSSLLNSVPSASARKKRSIPVEAEKLMDDCKNNKDKNAACQQIAKFLTQIPRGGAKEETKHKVIFDPGAKRKKRASDALNARSRRKREIPTTATPPNCTLYSWRQRAVDKLFGPNVTRESLTLDYNSTVDLCLNQTHTNWAYIGGSCSAQLLNKFEIKGGNLIMLLEYSKKQPANQSKSHIQDVVTVGWFSGSRSNLKVAYPQFSVVDVKLPRRPLKICAAWQPPWLSWETDDVTGESTFKGYLADVLGHLSTSMNFTYEMVLHTNLTSRDRLSDQQMERFIFGMFENDSCDFFLFAKSIRGGRLGRADSVDLSLAFQQPSMFLLTRRSEKTESINIWQFMTPFHEESWIYLWSCFICVSLFMAWINHKNPYEYQKIAATFGPDSDPSDHLGVLNSLWFTFSSIVQQGVDIVPRSRAAKMLTGAWWFFGLTIITAYTANMTLFMTQVNKGGIETLDQLASQKEFSYGMMHDNPMLELFLPDAKERPYTLLYNYLKNRGNSSVFSNTETALEKILEGGFYLMASFETTVQALTQSCEFDKVGSGFYQYQFALPFPKGSLVVPLFNDHISRLRDRGILSQLEDKWFSLESRCESNVEQTLENQLDIKAFTGMYAFLIIGSSIGVFICVLEIWWVRFGGIQGMFGKARRYQLEENKPGNRKHLDLLEDEFENWKGGWEVWKFKEWSNHGNPNAMEKDKKKQELFEKIKETAIKHSTKTCGLCGKTVKQKDKTRQYVPYRSTLVTPMAMGKVTDSGRSSALTDVYDEKSISEKTKAKKTSLESIEVKDFKPTVSLPQTTEKELKTTTNTPKTPQPTVVTTIDHKNPKQTTNLHQSTQPQVAAISQKLPQAQHESEYFSMSIPPPKVPEEYVATNNHILPQPEDFTTNDHNLPQPEDFTTNNHNLPLPENFTTNNHILPQPQGFSTDDHNLPQPQDIPTNDHNLPQPEDIATNDYQFSIPVVFTTNNHELPQPEGFATNDYELPQAQDFATKDHILPQPEDYELLEDYSTDDHELPQFLSRADTSRQYYAPDSRMSIRSFSSLASGPLNISGISASDWTISTVHHHEPANHDAAFDPPDQFSEALYDEITSDASYSTWGTDWTETDSCDEFGN